VNFISVQDGIVEGLESLTVILMSDDNVTITTDEAVIDITDQEGMPRGEKREEEQT
jgi:hypothetical protein